MSVKIVQLNQDIIKGQIREAFLPAKQEPYLILLLGRYKTLLMQDWNAMLGSLIA